MKTVEVRLSLSDAMKLLSGIDKAEMPWQLLPDSFKDGCVVFELYQDGSDTGHSIHLRCDGTWYFYTHIQVSA